jgi:hypothetical protein
MVAWGTQVFLTNKKNLNARQATNKVKKEMEQAIQSTIEMTCKFVLCVLLTQMGKTFTTIGRIMEELTRDEENGRSIHLVWTMNTLLNNTQFANRLRIIEAQYGDGSVVIFASKYAGTYKHVRNLHELLGLIVDSHTCPRVIVMCSNDVRYSDGFEFINILNTNTTNIKRVFAYYDELHQYITDKLREQIEQIDKMSIVHGIMGMTATPDRILLKSGYWALIRMILLDDFNHADYAGVSDMNFHKIDDYFPDKYKRPGPFDFEEHDKETLGFLNHVLDKYPHILAENSRVFIPGHVRRLSHQAIRTEVFKRCIQAIVVVLNGEEKTLEFYKGDEKCTFNLTSPTEEVCKTIARRVKELKLLGRPLVITGYLCVGMGQTLIEESRGPFTSAIFSHLSLTNDEIYQLFGRLTGRSKSWETYVPTDVYCPTKIMYRASAMEECAKNLATQHNGELISDSIYKGPLAVMGIAGEVAIANIRAKKEKKVKIKMPDAIEHPVGFKTPKEATQFLRVEYKRYITTIDHFISNEQTDGYTISTRLNSTYKKKKAELTSEDRLTMEYFKSIDVNANINRNPEKKGQPYCVYAVYKNLESDKSDFLYYVRYMPLPVPVVTA